MLRYVLLAGAAAVAIPCAGLAQVQWSQPLTGENQASSVMNQGGPLNSMTDYDIPFNQAPTGVNASDYNPTPSQSQTLSAQNLMPDESDDTVTAQTQPAGAGVYGSQPTGGYYYSSQGDQPMASADQTAPDQSGQGYYTGEQGTAEAQADSGQAEGAYSGQPYQSYGGGGYYTNQPGAPPSYVGQGPGSSESPQMGQGLGGEGAYKQGNVTPNQGYAGGGYYTGEQGTYPNQPSANPPQGSYGNQGYQGGYYTGQQGAYPNQPYANQPQGTYGNQGYQGGYYTGQQGAYPSQPYASQPQGTYGQGYQGGYYTGQQGAYGGQSGYYTGQPTAGQVENQPSALVSQKEIVVVGAHGLSPRQYVRKTTISNVYEIEAARIALQRSQNPEVRDYANQMIQEHQQGLAVITRASAQAGVPQRPMLDYSHRRMLARLQRVPDSAFDRVYMNQQLGAHMDAASVQEGYARHGDNPVLQQTAAQLSPVVEKHLSVAWNTSDMPARLAQQRNSELALLDQTQGRGQVYRGYTSVGPNQGEAPQEGGGGYGNPNYQGYSSPGGAGQYQGQPQGQYQDQYQGQPQGGVSDNNGNYSSGGGAGYGGASPASYQDSVAPAAASVDQQGQAGAAQPGYGGATGAPGGTAGGYQGYTGYQGSNPGVGTPGGTGTGYQPYTPGAGAQGTQGTTSYGTGAGIPGTGGYGSPQYQGYTSPGMGTTAPGTTSPGMGTTTPGATPSTPGYQGFTGPGYAPQGAAPPPASSMGTTTPGATSPTPGSPRGGASGPGG